MSLSLDWKFAVTMAATLAGVVVPVWLWQSDQRARSIVVRVVSETSLQPELPSQNLGLRLTFGDRQLNRATLTVLELENNGTRPIPAADFEAPIEISVQSTSNLLRVEATAVKPHDIRPIISSNATNLILQPLLLNPRDTVSLSVLTEGEAPRFNVRSRIAGVPGIEVSRRTEDTRTKWFLWMQAVAGGILMYVYIALLALADFGPKYPAGRRAFKVWAFIVCWGSVLLFFPLIDAYQLTLLQFFGILAGVVGVLGAIVFTRIFLRRNAP